MALLGAESFDLYGTAIAEILLRGYVQFTCTLQADGRTGVNCLQVGASNNQRGFGKVLDAAVNVLGAGVAIKPAALPAGDANYAQGIRLGNATTDSNIAVTISSTFGFNVWLNNVLVGSSAPNLWVLGGYTWIEVKGIRNTAGANTGSIEVRDGQGNVLVLVAGVDIPAQFTRHSLGFLGASGGSYFDNCKFDDWIWWDDSGAFDNTFFGDTRCPTVYPNADTAEAAWTPSTGVNGYACIDEAVPSDVDYVQATAAAQISSYSVGALPFSTNSVRALIPVVRNLKTDAGTATMKVGVKSVASNSMSADKSPNTTASYFSTVVARNPDGTVPWTKTTAENAKLRIERTG